MRDPAFSLRGMADLAKESSDGWTHLNAAARPLIRQAAEIIEAAECLLKALDDMHARGETFTGRVSCAAYNLKQSLEKKD
jgi:hypothetical protein